MEYPKECIKEIKRTAKANEMRKVIGEAMHKQKYTVYEMNKILTACGHQISKDCLYRYFGGRTKLNSETLGMVCAVLNLKLQ